MYIDVNIFSGQVADDFMDITSPLKALSDAAVTPFGKLLSTLVCFSEILLLVLVWTCSAHTSQVDVQLNSTMRLIAGTLHFTPLPWLPVLSNIEPTTSPTKKASTDKLVEKIVKRDSWPIQPDILNPPLL